MRSVLKTLPLAAALAVAMMLAGAPPISVAFAQTTSPSAPTSVSPSTATIKTLQEALASQGIAVTVDGVLSDETRAAIRKYQSQHHLAVTGEPDKATLDKLGVAARLNATPTQPPALAQVAPMPGVTPQAPAPGQLVPGPMASGGMMMNCPMMQGAMPGMMQMMHGMMQMMQTMQSMQPSQMPMRPSQMPMQPSQMPMQPSQMPMQPSQMPMQPPQMPMQPPQRMMPMGQMQSTQMPMQGMMGGMMQMMQGMMRMMQTMQSMQPPQPGPR